MKKIRVAAMTGINCEPTALAAGPQHVGLRSCWVKIVLGLQPQTCSSIPASRGVHRVSDQTRTRSAYMLVGRLVDDLRHLKIFAVGLWSIRQRVVSAERWPDFVSSKNIALIDRVNHWFYFFCVDFV